MNTGTGGHVLLWILGALALIALAGPAPEVATLLVIVLIAGVLLAHYQEYATLFGG